MLTLVRCLPEQEISPGHVYTEIAERAYKCDKDIGKAILDQVAPEVHISVISCRQVIKLLTGTTP